MTLSEIIRERRSIREYEAKPVPRDELLKVLEAGRMAPSSRNKQNWNITVVENEELRHKLVEASLGQPLAAKAPAMIVLWATGGLVMSCGQITATVDCSIALSFMMLKAAELGLGTCWMGGYDPEAVKKVLGLPEDAAVVAMTPIGYPAETPNPTPRKPMDEIVHFM